jgi:hypothetical protein
MENWWLWFHRLGPLAALAVIIGFPFAFWSRAQPAAPGTKLAYWLIAICALIAFVLIVGHAISGLFFAALIDERNKMSLSRLQVFIWTVIVLSGYFTAALWNLLATDVSDPLAVQLPQELWWLLGISTTSFVASPLILSPKTKQEPTDRAMAAAAARRRGEPAEDAPADIPRNGVVARNAEPAEASFADMFRGDEVGNERSLDMGKIQMFFFTIIVVLAYGVGLGTLFLTSTGVVEAFPALSQSILVLLGISHAGYLTYKGVSHTPTVP